MSDFGQLAGDIAYGARTLMGFDRAAGHLADGGGEVARGLRSFEQAVAKFGCGGGLLLDSAGDGRLIVVDVADDLADAADRRHGALGVGLDRPQS